MVVDRQPRPKAQNGDAVMLKSVLGVWATSYLRIFILNSLKFGHASETQGLARLGVTHFELNSSGVGQVLAAGRRINFERPKVRCS